MLRHRSLSQNKFLQAVGLECLGAYADARGLSPPSDLADDQIAKWLRALNDAERVAVLEQWHMMNDVCDEAVECLDLAYRRSHLEPDDNAPRELLAMRLFLEDRASFDYALDLYEWRDAALRMSHFRLPINGVSGLPSLDDFESMVSAHFKQSMRSPEVRVRGYEEAGVWILLVAHGDYQETRQAWTPDGPQPHFFRPARQDVLQYNPTSGVFSMRLDGRPTREDQQMYVSAFSKHCLGVPPRELAELESTISLEPIRTGQFSYQGNEHIEWVRLAAADLRFDGGGTAAVIRAANLLEALDSSFRGTRIEDANLTFVKLHMKVRGQRGRPRAVTLRPPAKSEITRDAAIIEAYLRQQGVLLA